MVMTGWEDGPVGSAEGTDVGQTRHIVDGMVPKHEQLRAILIDLARSLAPGDILPSERQLCLDHAVSRITVRKAIGQLVTEGLLATARGKGTFVAARTARSRLHLASFSEEMRRMGMEPSTVVLTVERAVPPPRTLSALSLGERAEAFRIRRLRLADKLPISVDDGWYPAGLFPGLDELDLTSSIYRALADRYGRTIDRAEQTVGSAEAGGEVAALLGVAPRRPVLVADRVSYSGEHAVEHTLTTYRGDRYELQMTLVAREDRPGPAGR
jgi:GntR family transcriptional regulator, N-acetylglucosamine utilization regulator